jgi:hypothetical protein
MMKINNFNCRLKIQFINPKKNSNNLICEILREETETLRFFKHKIKIRKVHKDLMMIMQK